MSVSPSDATAFSNPATANASGDLGYGIPDTSQGAQFLEEEQAAAAARGGGNPFAGWTLPPEYAGDFWQLYTQAETFAANTGWKYLLTPQQLIQGLQQGMADANSLQVYQWMASLLPQDVQQAMPWAALGMNATQYSQAQANVGDALYSVTGQTDFNAAGLGAIGAQAMFQGWSSGQITDYILKNPTLANQYGYLKVGQNYQQFQTYQIQNRQALTQRFGTGFTQAQAIESLTSPTQAFTASGGAFGQYVPYSPSSTNVATGRQSTQR
jgi:hypothetical protein